jgi:hypothetical protein
MISNTPPKKGMVFAGCSFTWGQGLYYYSNLPSLEGKEPPPDHWYSWLVTHSHLRYMESVRYPRIVANHFKTWELVTPGNGGSNQFIVKYWSERLTDQEASNIENSNYHHPNYNYKDISHLIFQLTQYQRDNFIFEHNGTKYNMPLHEINKAENINMFLDYLQNTGKTFAEWEEEYIANNINNVVQFLQKIESKGIKVYVMAWEDIYFPQVKANAYLNSKLIKLNYRGKEYETIREMMQANRELEIKYDVANFIETPKDHHPSMLCHQVMAENVINTIESRG